MRSSKSFTSDLATIKKIQSLPPCNILVSGQSSGSVARNVLAEWKQRLGAHRFKNNKDGKDEYTTIDHIGLNDKKFYIRGGGKANDELQIQGATFGYWLGDEIPNHTKEFVDMALSRLSLPFSQAVWTSNPDKPNHFIKTDFIDREHSDPNYFKCIPFTLDDNSSLTDKVKQRLKNSFFGVFYQRKILGQWVKAEGLVFPMFEEKYIVDEIPRGLSDLRIGVDYGTQNPMTYNFWGKLEQHQIKFRQGWYKIAEYHHSGREESKRTGRNEQKTNAQYCEEMKTFFKENNIPKNTPVICDPSATSFKLELFNNGFNVQNGNNKILQGIEKLSNLMGKGLIYYHKSCVETLKELGLYAWDEKKGLKGVDMPLKDNDHHIDGDRYALNTSAGGMR